MPLLPPPPSYPPAWCNAQYNNGLRVANVGDILVDWRARASAARATTRHRTAIAYGDDATETFDLFEPSTRSTEPAPLLVFIHGGYWRSLSKNEFSWVAPEYVRRGVKVAVVDYGLAPRYPLETIVRQNLRAIAWMWLNAARLGVAPDRIVVAGHSAGGHLTAMMLAARWSAYDARLPDDLLRGGVAISGLFDLEPIRHAPYLNGDLLLTLDRVAPLSPLYMTPASAAPLIMAVGGDESDEFLRHTRELGIASARTSRCRGRTTSRPASASRPRASGCSRPRWSCAARDDASRAVRGDTTSLVSAARIDVDHGRAPCSVPRSSTRPSGWCSSSCS
jgi:arylformamidase